MPRRLVPALRRTFPVVSQYFGQPANTFAVAQRPFGGSATLPIRPLVFAHYYLWYNFPGHAGQWSLCSDGDLPKQPLGHPWWPALGEYESSDDAVIAEHIRQFKAQGLDGITLNYWGYDVGFSMNGTLQKIANALEAEGILFFAFYEPASIVSLQARDWLLYVHENLAKNPSTGEWRSNYLWLRSHVTGIAKPVLLLQSRAADNDANYPGGDHTDGSYFDILRDSFISTYLPTYDPAIDAPGFYTISPDIGGAVNTLFALAHYDGAFIYNPIFLDSDPALPDWKAKLTVMQQAKAASRNFCIMSTVVPGYNDSGENVDFGWTSPTNNERSRNGGTLFQAYWNAHRDYCPGTDIVLITSFNEHGEGSGTEEQTTDFPQTVAPEDHACPPDPPVTIEWTQGFGATYTQITADHINSWKSFKLLQGRFPALVAPGS